MSYGALGPAYPETEKAHGLPAGVLDAIIAQESAGNPDAVRYEPAFYFNYLQNRSTVGLGGYWPGAASEATERIGRATSWGLMQIMGQTAREFGYQGQFFTAFCSKPEIGVEYGARYLSALLKKYVDLGDAISAYNAGHPTPDNRDTYVAPILARMAAEGKP